MTEERVSLRDAKKAETRAAILAASREYFADKGFEATTLEDVCEAARVSRRTFFRYFDSKEALVFPNHEARLERFRDFLDDRPPTESVFDRLNAATATFAAEYVTHRDQILAAQSLVRSSSRLLSRERAIDREWERVIEEAFASELPSTDAGRRRARVLAGATIGVIRATMRYWFNEGAHEDLEMLGRDALTSLQTGFMVAEAGATPGPGPRGPGATRAR